MKYCTKCWKQRPLDQFVTVYGTPAKTCLTCRSASWPEGYIEKGIATSTRFRAWIAGHNGKCQICQGFVGSAARLDHDHSTGMVRGLLCHTCNMSLGGFKDNPEYLTRAITYLAEARTEFKYTSVMCILSREPKLRQSLSGGTKNNS